MLLNLTLLIPCAGFRRFVAATFVLALLLAWCLLAVTNYLVSALASYFTRATLSSKSSYRIKTEVRLQESAAVIIVVYAILVLVEDSEFRFDLLVAVKLSVTSFPCMS
jgi:hypothetical protein